MYNSLNIPLVNRLSDPFSRNSAPRQLPVRRCAALGAGLEYGPQGLVISIVTIPTGYGLMQISTTAHWACLR